MAIVKITVRLETEVIPRDAQEAAGIFTEPTEFTAVLTEDQEAGTTTLTVDGNDRPSLVRHAMTFLFPLLREAYHDFEPPGS